MHLLVALILCSVLRGCQGQGDEVDVEVLYCDESTVNKINRLISSPGYPNFYPPNSACIWYLRAPKGKVIEVKLIDVQLDDCKTVVAIFDGLQSTSDVLAAGCSTGPTWPHFPSKLMSTGSEVRVVFTTDAVIERGFQLAYAAVDIREAFLLVSDTSSGALFKFDLLAQRLLVSATARSMAPVALDIDKKDKRAYFVNGGAIDEERFIARMFLDDLRYEILHYLNDSQDLAVDSVSGLLYWTEYNVGTISVSSLDGTKLKVIIDELDHPYAIAVDPVRKVIFWTEVGALVRICMAEGSGASPGEIYSSQDVHMVKPYSLAVNVKDKRLYWSDLALGQVNYVHYSEMKTIHSFIVTGMTLSRFALSLEALYIIEDQQSSKIVIIDNDLDGNMYGTTMFSSGQYDFAAVAVYNSSVELYDSNECSGGQNGGCENALCLPTQVGRICSEGNIPLEVTNCPQNAEGTVIASDQSLEVTWEDPMPMDPLNAELIEQSHHSGDEFEVGSTSVVYRWMDSEDNQVTCRFIVIIVISQGVPEWVQFVIPGVAAGIILLLAAVSIYWYRRRSTTHLSVSTTDGLSGATNDGMSISSSEPQDTERQAIGDDVYTIEMKPENTPASESTQEPQGAEGGYDIYKNVPQVFTD